MYEIYADNKLLFSTKLLSDPNYTALNAKVDYSDIGRAGSLSFTLLPGHPLYNFLKEKKTNVVVKSNGSVVVFKGCVSSARIDFYNQKEVRCDGDLTYLTQSQVRPVKTTKTAEEWFRYYIAEHNKRVQSDRQFEVGTITNDDAKTNVSVDESSYQNTKSSIESNLINYYGGYLRTRDQNGKTLIDWIKDYGRKSSQIINFGENLLDLNREISPDEAFSILIPIGQDGLKINSVNGDKDYIEVPGAVDLWGRIERVVDFSNISDATKLKEIGQKYIDANYDAAPLSITVDAVNLAHLGVNTDEILIGDKVRIVSKPHGIDKDYLCVSVSYDLCDPGKTSYTFGKKIQDLTQKYSRNASATSDAISEAYGSASRGTGAVSSKLEKYIKATDDRLVLMHDNIELNAQNIALNAEQIALRATVEEVTRIGKRISTVEIDLNGDETTIGLKAELRETIDKAKGLDQRLSRAEIDINGAEGTIGLKASVAENKEWLKRHDGTFEMLDRRVSAAEIDINGAEGTIGLKTSVNTLKKDLDEETLRVTKINERLTSAEIDINGAEGTIGLKTSLESTIKRVDSNTGNLTAVIKRVDSAEINIDAAKKEIQLKASSETVNKLTDRVTKAESSITVNADAITSKVSKNGVISSINQTAEDITIQANKVNLSGYVTASTLSAEIATINRFFSGDSVMQYMHATKGAVTNLTCTTLSVNGNSLGWKYMTVVNSFTQASGETSTGENYTLAGVPTIPSPVAYRPAEGETITF